MAGKVGLDWGQTSAIFDDINEFVAGRSLPAENEAQTRYDVIDRLIREVLGWRHGTVRVEEYAPTDEKAGYVDYILRLGDASIVVEAKKIGASFPTPTDKSKLKIGGAVLSSGDISAAIRQAKAYAERKEAQVVVVTNGLCWCFFNVTGAEEDKFASLLFPFTKAGHAEKLFDLFASDNVAAGSLTSITNELPQFEERLLDAFHVGDDRVDRNNIADHIAPALDQALYSESLLNNPDALRRCFVTTEARTKFDAMLGMHLADPKPIGVTPAKRITRDKRRDHLEALIANGAPSYAPPVTLIIGPVGAGKSTYLKHFELISGREVLDSKSALWMYIDLEAMGKGGEPRRFIYERIREYLGTQFPRGQSNSIVEAAYASEISALRDGPLALIAGDEAEIKRLVSRKLFDDYEKVEPYVDKVLGYLASQRLAVIVLDNIDLYEDDALETAVFAEGLALSKRAHCHVVVSIRDTTFVRHKTDSAFDAYELRKLWLDPPPLKAVISARLTYSKKILEKKSATLDLPNNKYLTVPDLSVFFDIVQQSILRGQAGDYVEAIADLNVRKGISLVRNFLTSGHIEADRAIGQYLLGDTQYYFPFHEVFKGSMLGQWRHFSEARSEGINIFDSRLGARRLRPLRYLILQFLLQRAKSERSMEVSIAECCDTICRIGATPAQLERCIEAMQKNGLVRTVDAAPVSGGSSIVVTRCGGFYVRVLSRKFVYAEECLYDTAIDAGRWSRVHDLTASILTERNQLTRMQIRKTRMMVFLQGMQELEEEVLEAAPELKSFELVPQIREALLDDVDDAINKIQGRGRRFPRGQHS